MKCSICKNYYRLTATHHLRLTILNSATQHINSTINLFYCFCHATSSIRTTKEATINSQWHKNVDRIDHTHSRPRSRPAGTDSGSCKRRCTAAWTCSRQQSPADCRPHLGCRRLQSDFQHTSADLQHAQTYTNSLSHFPHSPATVTIQYFDAAAGCTTGKDIFPKKILPSTITNGSLLEDWWGDRPDLECSEKVDWYNKKSK